MNRYEAEYALILEAYKRKGGISDYRFEAFSIRLGKNTFYIPDFMVISADGEVEFHEVKGGHWEDDARVKIKAAAHQYPMFRFVCHQKQAKKDGGNWKVEEF